MTHAVETMKAVYFDHFGGPEQLKVGQMPIPKPKPLEVQIKILWTSVNPVDWKIRSGLFQGKVPHQFPIIPGWDTSGIISDLGQNVDKFKRGDEVFAFCRKPIIQEGTYAEFTTINSADVAFKPKNLSFAQAAAIPLAGLTVWQALFDAAKLKKGEYVLIQAGAGGVGSLAIQFAKITGAHVATTASESNHAYVKSLGADIAIDYKKNSVKEEMAKFSPNGCDVVFDTVGGKALEESYSYLKPGGRLVSIVQQPDKALGEKFKIEVMYVFVSPNSDQLQLISNLIQDGKVKPIQIQEMPLEKASLAQEENEKKHTTGKIVLKI